MHHILWTLAECQHFVVFYVASITEYAIHLGSPVLEFP